jgi:hypothetical protein
LCGNRAGAWKFWMLHPEVILGANRPRQRLPGAARAFLIEHEQENNRSLQLCLLGVAQDAGENQLAGLVVDYCE